MNTKDIVILAVYGYILFYVLKSTQIMAMILLTVAAFCFLNSGSIDLPFDLPFDLPSELPANLSANLSANLPHLSFAKVEGLDNNGSNQANGSETKETDSKPQKISDDSLTMQKIVEDQPLNMGPYDGICLQTGNKDYWMKSPENKSLVPNNDLFTYLGSQGPLKMRLSDQAALIGPPVDGVKGSPEKNFMFANNVTSPMCCPSTFSSSTGCVCTTQNQRDFVAARGVMGSESKDNEY